MGEDDRIVAMGFPSESMEAAFRNPMKEVLKYVAHSFVCILVVFECEILNILSRLLDSKHKDHYKVYNLYVIALLCIQITHR